MRTAGKCGDLQKLPVISIGKDILGRKRKLTGQPNKYHNKAKKEQLIFKFSKKIQPKSHVTLKTQD